MQEWINTSFPVLPDGNVAVFQDYLNNDIQQTVGIDPLTLENTLAGGSVPPKYSELSALPIAQQGWQRIFDDWKERGLVK